MGESEKGLAQFGSGVAIVRVSAGGEVTVASHEGPPARSCYVSDAAYHSGRFAPMRDFSWKIFEMTGGVESYLLYREVSRQAERRKDSQEKDGEQHGRSGNG